MQVSIFGVTMGNFPDKRQPVSERFHRIAILLSIPEEIGNGDIEPRRDARGESRRVCEAMTFHYLLPSSEGSAMIPATMSLENMRIQPARVVLTL
jgi:hypothetical protein